MSETGNEGGTRETGGTAYVTKSTTMGSWDVPAQCWNTRPRAPHIAGDVAMIPLTKGAVALVDAADLWRVEGVNWHLREVAGRRYAARSVQSGGVRSAVYMHIEIAAPGPGMDVDHRHGDGLDNRRANLREATRQQNLANTGPRKANKLGVKGVWKHGLKYRASILQDGKTRHLGGYATIEEASAAYQAAARELHGEFAR